MASAIIGARLLSNLHERMEEKIAEHKGWYFLQAIACFFAGVLAIGLPTFTALSFETLIGALLAISGAVKGVSSIKSHIHWWSFLSAALMVIVGALMLWQPIPGVIALATLVALFLLTEGLTEICLALEFESARNWGWLLVSGIISVLLSVLLFFGWPGMTVMFLGVLIGVNLMLYGISLLAVSAATPSYDVL